MDLLFARGGSRYVTCATFYRIISRYATHSCKISPFSPTLVFSSAIFYSPAPHLYERKSIFSLHVATVHPITI